MNTKNIVIGVLVVLVLVFGILYYQAQSNLGRAGIGPTQYQTWNFLSGLFAGSTGQFKVSDKGKAILGGLEYEISSATVTFTNAQLCSVSFIDYTSSATAAIAAPTITFPAATSTPCLPTIGDSTTLYIRNTATSSITLSGVLGGVTFISASSTTASAWASATIPSSTYAVVKALRTTASTMLYFVNVFLAQ